MAQFLAQISLLKFRWQCPHCENWHRTQLKFPLRVVRCKRPYCRHRFMIGINAKTLANISQQHAAPPDTDCIDYATGHGLQADWQPGETINSLEKE